MAKRYSVVEIFPTIQGEGKWAGRAAVFARFSGCNMWDGNPAHRDRGKGACARWCDTNFAKGDPMELMEVLTRLEAAWNQRAAPGEAQGLNKMVVITGGEPCLQLDDALAKALSHEGWFTAVETNGTIDNPTLDIIDHVCVSPKRGSALVVWGAHELKVVVPGGVQGAPPEHQWDEDELLGLAKRGQWGALYVQPQDVTDQSTVELTALTHLRSLKNHSMGGIKANALYEGNVATCVDFVQRHPSWRLSLQTHKMIGVR